MTVLQRCVLSRQCWSPHDETLPGWTYSYTIFGSSYVEVAKTLDGCPEFRDWAAFAAKRIMLSYSFHAVLRIPHSLFFADKDNLADVIGIVGADVGKYLR